MHRSKEILGVVIVILILLGVVKVGSNKAQISTKFDNTITQMTIEANSCDSCCKHTFAFVKGLQINNKNKKSDSLLFYVQNYWPDSNAFRAIIVSSSKTRSNTDLQQAQNYLDKLKVYRVVFDKLINDITTVPVNVSATPQKIIAKPICDCSDYWLLNEFKPSSDIIKDSMIVRSVIKMKINPNKSKNCTERNCKLTLEILDSNKSTISKSTKNLVDSDRVFDTKLSVSGKYVFVLRIEGSKKNYNTISTQEISIDF